MDPLSACNDRPEEQLQQDQVGLLSACGDCPEEQQQQQQQVGPLCWLEGGVERQGGGGTIMDADAVGKASLLLHQIKTDFVGLPPMLVTRIAVLCVLQVFCCRYHALR